MTKQLQIFFKKHHFERFTISSLSDRILVDMKKGLESAEEGKPAACQPMIPVYGLMNETDSLESVIVIDAGGTNFRSCIVNFSAEGKPSITDFKKSSMPGIEHELSKDKFYNAIADKIDYLKDKASKIGFCFSYAMNMTEDNDGQVIVFSKEIKASEVQGTYVGKELKAVLESRGWKNIQKITLVNDTVAALLSSYCTPKSSIYSSRIGFVFGTGINNAYIESEKIQKIKSKHEKHIVVCECGMYRNLLSSDFDMKLDMESTNPGESILEKMCSGAYLGKLAYLIIRTACEEHIFSAPFTEQFLQLKTLTAVDVDQFLSNPASQESTLGAIISSGCISDVKKIEDILNTLIGRCASIITAVLTATLIKCGEGKNKEHPVGIICDGSTFWKCHNLANTVEELLKENLSGRGEIHYEILKLEDDITLGTAVAALRS